jgi:hypothetical protein
MTRLKSEHGIYVFWLAWSLLLIATHLAALGQNNTSYGTTLEIVHTLIAVLSTQLVRKETGVGKKTLFLSFAVLSFSLGLVWPIYNRFMHNPLSKLSPNLYFYLFQYLEVYGFFLLTLITFYLIVCMSAKPDVLMRYILGSFLASALCIALYFPYLQDSRYILKEPDVVDCRLVERVVKEMPQNCDSSIVAASIANKVELFSLLPNGAKVRLVGIEKEARIEYLLTYIRTNWIEGLVYGPLYRLHGFHGLFLALSLVVSIAWWFVKGPPASAYLEKIAWVLVPYCVLEGLHHLIFASLTDWERYESIAAIGVYFSVSLMIGMAGLFALRLRFIQTVEGNYYERRLLTDPSRITRWRDAFDNWVLKQFMNPGELDRRFLARRRLQD